MDLLTKTVEKCQEGTGKGSEVMQTQKMLMSERLSCSRLDYMRQGPLAISPKNKTKMLTTTDPTKQHQLEMILSGNLRDITASTKTAQNVGFWRSGLIALASDCCHLNQGFESPLGIGGVK